MKVIIAAAGTAGHINPGIAIANKIKNYFYICPKIGIFVA